MSDDSIKPAEVTPETTVVKPGESAVEMSSENAQAWLEKSERFVKLVAENLRYGKLLQEALDKVCHLKGISPTIRNNQLCWEVSDPGFLTRSREAS